MTFSEFLTTVLTFSMLGVIVAMIARSKGRSGFGWFIYGVVIFPVALVHILVKRHADDEDAIKCPQCAETIRAAAKVCRFCGHTLPDRSVETGEPEVRTLPTLNGLPPELWMNMVRQGSAETAESKPRRKTRP